MTLCDIPNLTGVEWEKAHDANPDAIYLYPAELEYEIQRGAMFVIVGTVEIDRFAYMVVRADDDTQPCTAV